LSALGCSQTFARTSMSGGNHAASFARSGRLDHACYLSRIHSSVIVAHGLAYTMGHDAKEKETVTCFDAATGEVRWTHSYPAKLIDIYHVGGPNASPTVIGDSVVTMSKDGQVFCLSRRKGEPIWSANLMEILGVKLPRYGFASSPVVHEGRVLLSSGKVTALDLRTGKTLWTSAESHFEGYTTPVVFRHGDKEFIAALDGKGLCILDSADGRELDRHPFQAT